MDERVEKAFGVANYMATLSNQRRIALEEFNQSLIYYKNGATFKVDQSLIGFTKSLIDRGHKERIPFVDSNNLPVMIENVEEFFNDILEMYFEAVNSYLATHTQIKSKRKIEDIVNL